MNDIIHFLESNNTIPLCFIYLANNFGGIIDLGGDMTISKDIDKVTCHQCYYFHFHLNAKELKERK